MLVLVLKTVHVLAAVLFLGVGLGSAWTKIRADRSGSPVVVAWAHRYVVHADLVFTVPSAVLVPATGAALVELYGLPWTTKWVLVGMGCYVLAGALWLVAVVLQLRMARLATACAEGGTPLPAEFHRATRAWLALGVPSFAASLLAIWSMVAKWP